MALCSRVVKSGVDSAIFFTKSRSINTSSLSSLCNRFDCRNISQLAKPNNNKRAFLVDTLALDYVLLYEIDKVTAGQRLDLNLERGRIRDELANQNAETSNLTNKLDREIHALRAHLEAAKYDVIKYCIGTLVSICAVGIATVRILISFEADLKFLYANDCYSTPFVVPKHL
ncbi:hypothetical protein SADUNF_Sadunf09G0101300 [Salix dunnii]|uniref:Uncharacterized protein n=1 Tax=Salix dunnii TaxID=1413687 RepID=A0A835JWQ2_9ROSI|nr:hypothetical protein SADUNF_Sadunf09G0101300 [Salix dunnii]